MIIGWRDLPLALLRVRLRDFCFFFFFSPNTKWKGNAKRHVDGFLSIPSSCEGWWKNIPLLFLLLLFPSTVCYWSCCWMINPFIIHHAIGGEEGGGVADRIIDGPIYKTVKANDSVYLHKKLSDFNRRGGARFLSIGNFERNAHKSTSFLPRLESFK